jgi:uncharacterized damage-inducible protein DinB
LEAFSQFNLDFLCKATVVGGSSKHSPVLSAFCLLLTGGMMTEISVLDEETHMKLTEFLLAELDREVERSRHALEQVPKGKYEWKPHEKSMLFGPLVNMVATIPLWIAMEITQDELDVAPAEGSNFEQKRMDTSAELIEALDKAAAGARSALEQTSEEHLMTNWRLLARGKAVMELPRYVFIQDTINHWAHHRGQMTVYLRLLGAKVPALYGPSADDNQFR